jgi:hypothetical protein
VLEILESYVEEREPFGVRLDRRDILARGNLRGFGTTVIILENEKMQSERAGGYEHPGLVDFRKIIRPLHVVDVGKREVGVAKFRCG